MHVATVLPLIAATRTTGDRSPAAMPCVSPFVPPSDFLPVKLFERPHRHSHLYTLKYADKCYDSWRVSVLNYHCLLQRTKRKFFPLSVSLIFA